MMLFNEGVAGKSIGIGEPGFCRLNRNEYCLPTHVYRMLPII